MEDNKRLLLGSGSLCVFSGCERFSQNPITVETTTEVCRSGRNQSIAGFAVYITSDRRTTGEVRNHFREGKADYVGQLNTQTNEHTNREELALFLAEQRIAKMGYACFVYDGTIIPFCMLDDWTGTSARRTDCILSM